MTQHKPLEKSADSDKSANSPETGQKLLTAAASGQWLKGYEQDLTQKLQQDGVLPGADVFDPGKVKLHLSADQQAHDKAAQVIDKLHGENVATRQAIDASKAADQSLASDFHTVSTVFHNMVKSSHDGADPNAQKTTITRADLQGLLHSGTAEAKAAAKRLLDNWDKNGEFTSASAEPNSPAALRNGVDPFMNETTLTRGMRKHDQVRAGQEKTLAVSVAHEADLQKAQVKLAQTMEDERQALTASERFVSAARLARGDGYYQAANRMLNLDGQKHTEAERKLMTKLLQQHLADQHNGKVPKVLTYKDISLTAQSVDKLFERIKTVADKTKS
jgi:hypothetical protein